MCHELLSVVWENLFAVDRTVLLHQRFCRVLLCCIYIWFHLFATAGSCRLADLVFSCICLLSAALCRLFQALSSWACVCCLLSLVCSSQDRLLFVRAKVT